MVFHRILSLPGKGGTQAPGTLPPCSVLSIRGCRLREMPTRNRLWQFLRGRYRAAGDRFRRPKPPAYLAGFLQRFSKILRVFSQGNIYQDLRGFILFYREKLSQAANTTPITKPGAGHREAKPGPMAAASENRTRGGCTGKHSRPPGCHAPGICRRSVANTKKRK